MLPLSFSLHVSAGPHDMKTEVSRHLALSRQCLRNLWLLSTRQNPLVSGSRSGICLPCCLLSERDVCSSRRELDVGVGLQLRLSLRFPTEKLLCLSLKVDLWLGRVAYTFDHRTWETGGTQSHISAVVLTDLELVFLLLPPSWCWDHRQVLPPTPVMCRLG